MHTRSLTNEIKRVPSTIAGKANGLHRRIHMHDPLTYYILYNSQPRALSHCRTTDPDRILSTGGNKYSLHPHTPSDLITLVEH